MKKYKVNIKRMEYGFVEIEAKDKQEAIDKARTEAFEAEAEGNATWNKEKIEIEDIEEMETSIKEMTKEEHREEIDKR